MTPRSNEPRSNPHGLTPLVQMFPMHIGETPPPPSRPGTPDRDAGPESPPASPGRGGNQAG